MPSPSFAMREFSSPSGRRWTARLYFFPNTGTGLHGAPSALTSGSVLRFASGDLTLDLADWPDDWHQSSDTDLVVLLRQATTPTFPPRSYLTPAAIPVQRRESAQGGA